MKTAQTTPADYRTTATEVTKEEFFARILSENLDVYPSIKNTWEADGERRGYISVWEFSRDPRRSAYGVTESGNQPFTARRYFLFN